MWGSGCRAVFRGTEVVGAAKELLAVHFNFAFGGLLCFLTWCIECLTAMTFPGDVS